MTVPMDGTTEEVKHALSRIGVDLSAEEALRVKQLIGRDPTLVELFIFDIMWSEHCSYKSSKRVLEKFLPTSGSGVVLGPGEDAGIVRLPKVGDASYVLMVAHESHNHPSQILPVEGAATGIGGIVRDVYCMGADVVGVMDSLRFGDPEGPRAEAVREICEGVVRGIWEYGNALGVPNVGGDVFFDGGYDENCLVNVIAIGVARESEIIRSRVPEDAQAEPYDLIIVGKPTDRSGLGGATMASRILDETRTSDMSAVQLHDPFLKRVLTEATKVVLARARESGVKVGFKDLGAGGIACAVSEMVDRGGFGARVYLDKVHLSSRKIEPYAIACSETQERYCLAVPSGFTETVLRIYNEDYELPHIYRGARASLIGHVTLKRDVVMSWEDEIVASLPAETITSGITYDRKAVERPRARKADVEWAAGELGSICMSVLSLGSVCSKHYVYRHYDSEVKGLSVLKPGEADACVICIQGTKLGIATSVDGNPRYSKADPYWGGVMAVCEGIRNLASVGAVPVAITDCLNFGNPEDPHVFWDFTETVRGIGYAARGLCAYGTDEPVPVVSGNVSFYNESSTGAAVPPSPIVGCYGLLEDYSVATSLAFKRVGSSVLTVGTPRKGLGGSALYSILNGEGCGMLPEIDLREDRASIMAVTEIMRRGLADACHDISEGGLFVTLAEMVVGGWGTGRVGARVSMAPGCEVQVEEWLFGEGWGFVLEVESGRVEEVLGICGSHGVRTECIGQTVGEHVLELAVGAAGTLAFQGSELRDAWQGSLERTIR